MIRIQNIYYMLAYAFQVLNEQGYKKIATEDFDNTAELCAAILARGISTQLKRGLGRQYIPKTEPLSSLRGKIDVTESIKTQAFLRKQMICTYDDFSVNAYVNRIIKSTVLLLLKADISKSRKKELKKLMLYFTEVEPLDLYSVNWNIQYDRNNQTYRMMISICYLVVKGLLQTQSDGTTKLMDFLDEQRMHRLYEKFILEYYRREFPQISANASQIPWQLGDDMGEMLPVMQTDIMLSHAEKVLIIDAKYYAHTTQLQYDKHTLHSGNLYQIFTYVKNKEAELRDKEHEVSGMLLYARTEEETQPDHTYQMSGNKISVRTLDLNRDFSAIRRQLYAGDGGDLSVRQEKINAFLKSCDELLEKHYPTSHLYKNDQRSAMAYLWFYDPEHNFMCKATEAQYLANAAEFYDDWGTYASFRLDVYYRFCAALLNEIRSNTALMNIHQSRFEGHEAEMHPDINLHILAFDIIYCARTYGLYAGVEIKEHSAEDKRLYQQRKAKAAEFPVVYRSI